MQSVFHVHPLLKEAQSPAVQVSLFLSPMPGKNRFRKLNLPPLISASTSESSAHPHEYARVKTSRQVKRAYHARQPVRSTPSGVYVLSQGRNALSESALSESALSEQDPQPAPTDFWVDPTHIPVNDAPSSPGSLPETPTAGWTSDYPSFPDPEAARASNRSKRYNQWTKWQNVILPALVDPYQALLHTTDNLCNINRGHSSLCTCSQTQQRTLNVVCVHFDCKLPAFSPTY